MICCFRRVDRPDVARQLDRRDDGRQAVCPVRADHGSDRQGGGGPDWPPGKTACALLHGTKVKTCVFEE